jgi:hypothetical protein
VFVAGDVTSEYDERRIVDARTRLAPTSPAEGPCRG